MAKYTPSKAAGKPVRPPKPYPDFPLFPHASGRWAKKIRGQFEYFGSWHDDPKGKRAGELWAEQRDDLLAGRRPRRVSDTGVTVKFACDSFLTAKEQRVDSGELSRRSWEDYKATCTRAADAFGRNRVVDNLAADDFRELRAGLAKVWGPVAINNEIGRVRVLFKWVYESGLIDRPVRYGPDFARSSRKVLRLVRAERGRRDFDAKELRAILKEAGVPIKAMILLGINCGLGNSDCARLRLRNLDLKGRWMDFPRPKTGVDRRCRLWPETVEALKAALQDRPTPTDQANAELVFITKYGSPWQVDHNRNSAVAHEFAKVLVEAEQDRDGASFYGLRHTLETVGSAAKDQVALDHMMGHAPPATDMASVYRERVDDARLTAVADHVRTWLFGKAKRKPK